MPAILQGIAEMKSHKVNLHLCFRYEFVAFWQNDAGTVRQHNS